MIRPIYLDEFFEQFYLPRRLIGASSSCLKKYRRHIRWLTELLGRRAQVSDLTDENIAAMMGNRLALKRSPGTVNAMRDQYHAIGRYAALKGFIDSAPDVAELREYKRTPTAWMSDELDRLFTAAMQEPGLVGSIRAGKWWYALLSVMWDCGARIGALMEVKPSQISLSRKTITVNAESQKQDADQEFELHDDTIAALKAIDFEKRDLIFPWPKSIELIWRDYRRILRRAGLPTTKRDLFHKMRRSVASWYERGGGDATKLLGHSSRKVTEAYLDPKVIGEKQASRVLRRPNSDPPTS